MTNSLSSDKPLVSVIITCYNHGRYLANAIDSLKSQTYQSFEIIVVDDGSVDNTEDVSLSYTEVNYVYQPNAGLSAARNAGVKHAKGKYLVFLDADDWLLDRALEINVNFLNADDTAAFVAGGYEAYYEYDNRTKVKQQNIQGNYYCELLKRNFIAMHATVMYHNWVFQKFQYNTSLRFCEDYDLYLQVTRTYPIIYHTELIAVYRKHSNNMSINYPGMMEFALLALSFQKNNLKTDIEKRFYNEGVSFWRSYYSKKMYESLLRKLQAGKLDFDKVQIAMLRKNNKSLYLMFIKQLFQSYTSRNYKVPFMNLLEKLYAKVLNKSEVPAAGKVNLGDFNRISPFSTQFGYDRGGPVDRYYIENFLQKNSSSVKGRVLEIGDNEYTLKYGGDKIDKSDILHIDDSNTKATYIGDLSDCPQLPSDTFDCIVLTQTLHLIYDFKGAIETCYRVLKPGGTLLLTVPGISHIAQDGWGKYWLWAFTDASMERIMGERFSIQNTTIETHGNVLVASAFLYGMGLPELKKEQMDSHDPHYQVIVTVSAVK
jgi:glycosyltransferase involved in cell wall biosynthesis